MRQAHHLRTNGPEMVSSVLAVENSPSFSASPVVMERMVEAVVEHDLAGVGAWATGRNADIEGYPREVDTLA